MRPAGEPCLIHHLYAVFSLCMQWNSAFSFALKGGKEKVMNNNMDPQKIEEIEKQFGLSQLKGTVKQLSWAREIRASAITADTETAAKVANALWLGPDEAVSDETAMKLGKTKSQIVEEFKAANQQLVIMLSSDSAKKIIENRTGVAQTSEAPSRTYSKPEHQNINTGYQSAGDVQTADAASAVSAAPAPGKHYFGEKDQECGLPVWQTPRFLQARKKACEMIDAGKYGLDDSDFWILMNRTHDGRQMTYNGLIISHNGCLKINEKLPRELRYNPHCITKCVSDYNESLTYTYVDEDVYEVGEVSKDNCKSQYPNAMALKRLLDRVILKKSSLAEAGIYSEVESDDFAQQSVSKAVETAPAQQTVSRQKTVNAASQVALPTEDQQQTGMTLEAAKNFRMPSGMFAGKLLGELAKGSNQEVSNIFVLANTGSGKERQAAGMLAEAITRGELN